MFKYMLPLSLLSVSMVSGSALSATLAAGGLINISGAISDTTCTINGGNSADMTILLDPITITDAGTTANTVLTKNQKTFSLSFSNCAPAPGTLSTTLKMHFAGSPNISSSGLYLVNDTVNENDTTVSRNVGFSLSNTSTTTTPIALNSTLDTGLTGTNTTGAGGTYSFVASYYKTNALPATAGSLHSSVIYTVSYL